MIGRRSLLSFCQLLELIPFADVRTISEKHGIDIFDAITERWRPTRMEFFRPALEAAEPARLLALVDEVVRTPNDMRARASGRHRYDERFSDLRACLALDGYATREEGLRALDPAVDDVVAPVEDDLVSALQTSALPGAPAVLERLTESAASFRRTPPNYNACLNDARVALQTLLTAIADRRRPRVPGNYDPTSFGQVLAYLRSTGFIDTAAEGQISGLFGFLSPGCHRPVGVSEQEMARLGRLLACGMCWFLVKANAADTA